MDRELLRQNITNSSLITFVLSGGPGGQNVNKVNTQAVVHLAVDDLISLSREERELVAVKLKNRLNGRGQLVVSSSKTRSQLNNRNNALDNLEELIVKALEKPKKRRATMPSRASVRRRLEKKKQRKSIKQNRGRVGPE